MSADFATEMCNFADSSIIYQKASTLCGGALSVMLHGIFLYRMIKCKVGNRESIEYLFLVQSACEFIATWLSIVDDAASEALLVYIKLATAFHAQQIRVIVSDDGLARYNRYRRGVYDGLPIFFQLFLGAMVGLLWSTAMIIAATCAMFRLTMVVRPRASKYCYMTLTAFICLNSAMVFLSTYQVIPMTTMQTFYIQVFELCIGAFFPIYAIIRLHFYFKKLTLSQHTKRMHQRAIFIFLAESIQTALMNVGPIGLQLCYKDSHYNTNEVRSKYMFVLACFEYMLSDWIFVIHALLLMASTAGFFRNSAAVKVQATKKSVLDRTLIT